VFSRRHERQDNILQIPKNKNHTQITQKQKNSREKNSAIPEQKNTTKNKINETNRNKQKKQEKNPEHLQELKRPRKINEPKKSLYAYLSISTATGCFRQDWLCVRLCQVI